MITRYFAFKRKWPGRMFQETSGTIKSYRTDSNLELSRDFEREETLIRDAIDIELGKTIDNQFKDFPCFPRLYISLQPCTSQSSSMPIYGVLVSSWFLYRTSSFPLRCPFKRLVEHPFSLGGQTIPVLLFQFFPVQFIARWHHFRLSRLDIPSIHLQSIVFSFHGP